MSASEPAIAIGIDLGTSGARAAALSASGEVVAFAAAPFPNPDETKEPAIWWERVGQCLSELQRQTSLADVKGVAVDGTSGTLVAIDDQGRPLDVLMYKEPCPDRAIVDNIAAAAPVDSPARGANAGLARAIYLARKYGGTRLVHQADWIAMRLGLTEPVSDENNALKTGYDLDAECWPLWITQAGLDIERLPQVRRAGTPIGVTGEAGKPFGLPETCRIHAGTTDGCASFLATGANAIGDGVTALGSTLVLKLASARPINAAEYGIYAHRVLDFWLIGGASNAGGAVIRALIGDDRLQELTLRLDPNRPTGLDYYPLLRPGERFPVNDPAYAPRLSPRPEDDGVFFQAILEGMTAIEKRGYGLLESLGGPALRSVRTVGGGARNPVWTQMRQKALGVDFAAPRSVEAAVGAASLVLARVC
ncbi:FGGY-family carbohydrate kinase [Brucella sp. IR073]|uniref:FGGY-family carbohydrate kinase n=1 Tax=unclassified Brucella TaxID=2632610 RepID=UPI003B980B7C